MFSIFIIDGADVHRSTLVNPCLGSTAPSARSSHEGL